MQPHTFRLSFPFRRHQADRVLNDLFMDAGVQLYDQKPVTKSAPVDVLEHEHHFEVQAYLPGFDKSQITVTVKDHELTISANKVKEDTTENQPKWVHREINSEAFSRVIDLPENVEPTKIEAKYENGVLTVTLPKRAETQPQTVTIG